MRAEPKTEKVTTATHPARILLADDEAIFSRVMMTFIEKEGYQCEHAADGPAALAALAREKFDLLIADIDMPGNRGLELVHALSEMHARPPIILLTGSPSLATATKSVGLAVHAYLTKPFEATELRRIMDEAITHERIRRAIRENHARITAWAEDIARIKLLLNRSSDAETGVQSYLALTLGNLVASLSDFAEVAEVIAGTDAPKKRMETAALTKALQETIAVLESTRHVFKSKELGALRKKLENLLQ
jgi:DNA-binding response OmpR family regulator